MSDMGHNVKQVTNLFARSNIRRRYSLTTLRQQWPHVTHFIDFPFSHSTILSINILALGKNLKQFTFYCTNFDGRSEEQASGSKGLCGWFSQGIRHEHCWRKNNIEGSRRFQWCASQKSLPFLWPLHESPHEQDKPWRIWELHTWLCKFCFFGLISWWIIHTAMFYWNIMSSFSCQCWHLMKSW